MTIHVFERESLATLSLARDSETLRQRQRPAHLRDADYDSHYDFHTLYYDAFLTADRKQVRLIGPVLANLAPYIVSGEIFQVTPDRGRIPLPFKIYQKRKVTYLDIDLPSPANSAPVLKLELGALGAFEIPVSQNGHDLFAGRRVAFTLFKYEPLAWLRDWIEFNVKYHGADAFLIYHNDSEDFSTAEVAAVLQDVPGVTAGAVLNWAFPYGPDGTNGDHWESNFCQVGMMAHARWRFLGKAKSALNGDIDELVLTKGHRSIFDIVEQSPQRYVIIPAMWSGYGDADFQADTITARRHKHMTYIVDGTSEKPAQNKWAVVPAACPDDSRWSAHQIGRMKGDALEPGEAGLRHFRDLNTNWKLQRSSDRGAIERDTLLLDAYRKIGWI